MEGWVCQWRGGYVNGRVGMLVEGWLCQYRGGQLGM